MGNIWGTESGRKRLVRFQNCSGSQKKMTMAGGLKEFRHIARQKLCLGMSDDIRIFEAPTGFELEDDNVFFYLDPDIPLTVMTQDQTWTRPPDLTWLLWLLTQLSQSHPLSSQPQHHQVAGRDASGLYTLSINVYNIRARQVQVGDRYQTVNSGLRTRTLSSEAPLGPPLGF